MEKALQQWCQEELSKLLGIPVSDDIVSYISSFENKRELESYLYDLLGHDNVKAATFIQNFLKRWQPQRTTACGGEMYQKSNSENGAVVFCGKATSEDSERQKESLKPKKMIVNESGTSFLDKTRLMEEEKVITSKKKGPKFVPLYTADGKARTEIMQYPGRHPCHCLGQKHNLINNCLECGRIVCDQEGSGPCLFCGTLVCTQTEQETLARNSRKSAKLYEKLMNPVGKENLQSQSTAGELDKAIAQKNRLLEYDRTSTRRTKVIDDQADYFTLNNWLSPSQKKALQKRGEELHQKRHKSRRDKTFTLDFAGRRVIEEETDLTMYSGDDDIVKSIYQTSDPSERNTMQQCGHFPTIADPRIRTNPPVFVPSRPAQDKTAGSQDLVRKKDSRHQLLIQDKEFQKLRDDGACLSMHQPWASLLVRGIKSVEGRSWYTAHRGRLWIAATAKQPDQEDIIAVENQYRDLYPGEQLPFPKEYPTGALLGCVDVADCVTNEEYSETSDLQEENDSQYIFLCEFPRELPIKFPVKGKHKIWKLEPHTHVAAKKSIFRI